MSVLQQKREREMVEHSVGVVGGGDGYYYTARSP